MSKQPRQALWPYAAAALLVALATAVRALPAPGLWEITPLAPFYVAVLLAAWRCGPGPAALATALGITAAKLLYLPPVGSFAVARPADQSRLWILLAVGVGAALLAVGRESPPPPGGHRPRSWWD